MLDPEMVFEKTKEAMQEEGEVDLLVAPQRS